MAPLDYNKGCFGEGLRVVCGHQVSDADIFYPMTGKAARDGLPGSWVVLLRC